MKRKPESDFFRNHTPFLKEVSGVKQLLESIAKLEAEMNPWEVKICRLECSQAALAASDAALAKGLCEDGGCYTNCLTTIMDHGKTKHE